MKTESTLCSPDVTHKALALLSGIFGERVPRAAEMGALSLEPAGK